MSKEELYNGIISVDLIVNSTSQYYAAENGNIKYLFNTNRPIIIYEMKAGVFVPNNHVPTPPQIPDNWSLLFFPTDPDGEDIYANLQGSIDDTSIPTELVNARFGNAEHYFFNQGNPTLYLKDGSTPCWGMRLFNLCANFTTPFTHVGDERIRFRLNFQYRQL